MTYPTDQRIAGVLIPTFAVRGRDDLGIGDTSSLMEFIDWAAENGFRLVKLLPINETGGDHSPYNALSSRALDPTTIRTSPEALPDLHPDEFAAALEEQPRSSLDGSIVNYEIVKPLKRRLLRAAFARFCRNHLRRKSARAGQFLVFLKSEEEWIHDYTLFRVLFDLHGGAPWDGWPEEHRDPARAREWIARLGTRKSQALEKQRNYFAYVQWIAFTQWRRVKAHAEAHGVSLMGDIPFGISFHSADVWAHPSFFRTNWCGGTPPDRVFKHDAFVQKWGQNWGIPLYDWEKLSADDFRWWRRRVKGVREFFDLFRIDHILGFYRIYGFPWKPERNGEFLPLSLDEARQRTDGMLPGFQPRPDDNGENKARNRQEGEWYLKAVLDEAGEGHVIGEDLGEVPDYVRPSLQSLHIAGYKIPQWEKRPDGSLIPGGEYERLSLATYATHDHDPLRAIWEQLARDSAEHPEHNAGKEFRELAAYAGLPTEGQPREFTRDVHLALLRALFGSNSWIAVAMITDLFGRTERFNSPGVANGANWTQRMHAPVAELQKESILPSLRRLLSETGRAS